MTQEELCAVMCQRLALDVKNLIESARREATAAERERCAKLVETAEVIEEYDGDERRSANGRETLLNAAAEIRQTPKKG